jgi:hypothetical protein
MTATVHQILTHAYPNRGGWTVCGDLIAAGDGGPVPTMEEIETHRAAAESALQTAADAAAAVVATRKIWADAGTFLDSFTFAEQGAISLSTHTTGAALRLILATWKTEIWSDDPRIVAGFAALVEAGIITTERRDALLAK